MAKRFLVIGLTSEVGYFMSIQDEVSVIIKNMLNTGHYCWCLKPRPFSDLSRGPCGAFCFILGCFFVVLSNSFIVI